MKDARGPIKIEVTGSNIPRSESESALPVQILSRDDIARSGAATTAELLSKVSANLLGFNDQLSIGELTQPGLSSANLRGIGSGSTLVLLNGRRVANYAFNGGTVDLNAIPLSAIDRVEILKDGASAIYGTDAIAGVINFILRRDFKGFEATGYGAWTEHGGGDQAQAIVSAGFGTLAADRFNAFATLSYQKDGALRAVDRPFSRTGYIPSEGEILLSSASFPANIQVAPRQFINPAFATGCTPPSSIPVNIPFLSLAPFCGYDFASTVDLVPQVERTGAIGRATLQIDANNQLFAEANYAYNRFVLRNSPTPIFQGPAASTVPVLYPAGGPYYPAAFAAANGISGDLNLRYRTAPLGPATDAVDTKALRVVLGAQGLAWNWTYDTAVTYSENRQTDRFASGYVLQSRFIPALATGLINPFGPSGPEGDALLAATQIVGDQHHAKSSTLDFDAKASKELYTLLGGPLAIALGTEARREKLDNAFSPAWNSGDVLGVATSQQSVSSSRSVEAVFAEASVPAARGIEAQIAARYDHYSDFGGTTNPKIALRWQPLRTLLLRTSWGTGFRAPALYDLFTPLSYGGARANEVDPVRCPISHLPVDCPGQFGSGFRVARGGNPNLRPEESEQFNAGIVWEVVAGLSLTTDYWKIDKRNVIDALNEAVIFGDFDRFAPTNVVRGPVDPNFPDLPGPIQTVLLTQQNLGDLRTAGIDVGVKWRAPATSIGAFSFSLDGTYVLTWAEQLDAIHYTSSVGRTGFGIIGPVPLWKHYAMLDWEYGPWGATIAQTYQSGYTDFNADRVGDALTVPPRNVGSYELWDLQVRYSAFRNTALALGVKNFMDRAPPFSNQPLTRQVGYDPKYADPRGRAFYVRLTYAFK